MKDSERLVSINEDELDVEWVGQPGLVFRYGEREADARHDYTQAKARLDLVEAQLLVEVRADPAKYELGQRPSVDLIKAVVTAHPSYRKALRNMLARKRDFDILSVAMLTLEHRKRALEKVVDLHLTGYRSEPRSHSPEFRARAEKLKAKITRTEMPDPRKGK